MVTMLLLLAEGFTVLETPVVRADPSGAVRVTVINTPCGRAEDPCYVQMTARSDAEVNAGWAVLGHTAEELKTCQRTRDAKFGVLYFTVYSGFIGLILFMGWFLTRLDRIVAAWRRSEMPKLPWRFIWRTFWFVVAIMAGEIVAHGIFR